MYRRTSYPPEFDSDLVACGLTSKHKDDTEESSDDSDDGSDADSSDDDSDESGSDKKKKQKQKGADADDGTEGELSMKELRDKLLEYVAYPAGKKVAFEKWSKIMMDAAQGKVAEEKGEEKKTGFFGLF